MSNENTNRQAHKLNSHLAIIFGYIQLLKKKLEDSQNKESDEYKWTVKVYAECVEMRDYLESLVK